jgi:cell division transport system permease protein
MRSLLKTSASKSASISSFVGTTLVLILVGLLFVFWILGSALTHHFQDQIVAQIMFVPNAAEEELLLFKKQIEGSDYCSAAAFTSSTDAAEIMKQELGNDFVGDVLGYNPLPASLDIKLKPESAHPEQIQSLKAEWEKQTFVKEVTIQESLLEKINQNIAHWTLILVVIASLLLTISIALIINTVELTIFSQRFIIRSMQLVGATQWFILKPFVMKSLWQGFRASLLALIAIFAGFYAIMNEWPVVLSIMIEKWRFAWVILGTCFVGLIVSTLSTTLSVRKFIRLRYEQLHQ